MLLFTLAAIIHAPWQLIQLFVSPSCAQYVSLSAQLVHDIIAHAIIILAEICNR